MIWDSRPRKRRISDALSRFGNVVLFNGQPDESISARSWRERHERKWQIIGRVANWLYSDPKHCEYAHRNAMDRARHMVEFNAAVTK